MQSVLEPERMPIPEIVNILILELDSSVTIYLADLILSNMQHGQQWESVCISESYNCM